MIFIINLYVAHVHCNLIDMAIQFHNDLTRNDFQGLQLGGWGEGGWRLWNPPKKNGAF